MATALVQRIEDYAGRIERVVDAPVDDAAAVLAIDAALLGGLLLGVKLLAWGLWYEFHQKPPSRAERQRTAD